MSFLRVFLAASAIAILPAQTFAADGPVIDVHLHALGAADQGPPPVGVCAPFPEGVLNDAGQEWGRSFIAMMKSPPCDDPIWSAMTDDELRDQTLAELRRLGVIGVLSGPRERVAAWKDLAPDHIIAGHQMNLERDPYSSEEVASYFNEGGFEVLAEVTNQYAGIAPNDPRFDDYWAVAEKYDIPVGIHIGAGPPGSPLLFPKFRASLHSPLLLEEVLLKHPRLRVYIMHAGWPMRDDLLAMLFNYPHLYVGVGVLQMGLPRAEYYDFLHSIVRAGYHKRIMFGSDQMVWPGLIEAGIKAIEEAPFLSDVQKRDILYNNAARFLRLSKEEITRHQNLASY